MLISVYCNTEFWSLSSDYKGPSIFNFWLFFFLLGLIGSGLGLMIFQKMSRRTYHSNIICNDITVGTSLLLILCEAEESLSTVLCNLLV